jgi:hypothetical protein
MAKSVKENREVRGQTFCEDFVEQNSEAWRNVSWLRGGLTSMKYVMR